MKKIICFGALFAVIISFMIYFYTFTTTDASNLLLVVDSSQSAGWKITEKKQGKNIPITSEQAVNGEQSVYMERKIPESWASYDRISVDNGRAISIFVDNTLVFQNHDANILQPSELPLMQISGDELFANEFSFEPTWVNKTMTLVTRTYENEPNGFVGITLESDQALMLQQEAWANRNAIPGAMFGIATVLLIGLAIYRILTLGKGYTLLLLALASFLQMLSYMGILDANPLPIINTTVATALYFLFPLLYLQTKMASPKIKKRFFWINLLAWGVYFITYCAVYEMHLPLPYWFDRVEILCFINLFAMLYYCLKEYRTNQYIKHFLTLLGAFLIGYILLFFVSAIVDPMLNEYILILFREASAYYFRPLLFWVYTTILLVLFLLAIWDVLQEQIHKEKQIEHMESEKAFLDLQVEGARNQLQSLRTSQEKTMIYRHDMRHHFSLLQEYAKENDMQSIQEYLATTKQTMEALTPKRYCESETVNLLLAAFEEKTSHENIELRVDARIPETLEIADHELCSLLANALENAIHAVRNLKDETKRVVEVQLQLQEESLLISTKNEYEGELLKDGVSFKSSQKGEGHGLGLKSMISIVEQHGGLYSFETNHQLFVLRLVVPMK